MADESDLSKLQAVKELIFGQEIKNYDSEFKNIHETIEKNSSSIEKVLHLQEKLFEKLEKTLTLRIDRVETDMQKKIATLEDKKTDRAKLGKLLIQIGEKLQDK